VQVRTPTLAAKSAARMGHPYSFVHLRWATRLHQDSICFDTDEAKKSNRIPFVPFIGIGPRRYLDFFSLDLSTGSKVLRSDREGRAIFPERAGRPTRVPMLPLSYLERETKLLQDHEDVINELEGKDDEQADERNTPEKQDGVESPPNAEESNRNG